MNKKKIIFWIFAISSFSLTACSQEKPIESSQGPVVVSRSIPVGEPRPLGMLKTSEDAQAFGKAFQTADKLKGELEMPLSDYEIQFQSGGKQKELLLWIASPGDSGMLMEKSDTSTGYKIDAAVAEDLQRRIMGIRYEAEQAEKNGDVIQGPSGTFNIETWHAFMRHVKQKRSDSVQLVSYTQEGDPIFHNLEYDGKIIHYLFDNSEDGYGTRDKRSDTCGKIVSEPQTVENSDWTGTIYRLDECSNAVGGRNERFEFWLGDDET